MVFILFLFFFSSFFCTSNIHILQPIYPRDEVPPPQTLTAALLAKKNPVTRIKVVLLIFPKKKKKKKSKNPKETRCRVSRVYEFGGRSRRSRSSGVTSRALVLPLAVASETFLSAVATVTPPTQPARGGGPATAIVSQVYKPRVHTTFG